MSKVLVVILSLFINLASLLIITTPVYALNTCTKITVEPDPEGLLTNKSTTAKFIINVGQNSAFEGKWKVEFKCGAPNRQENASLEKDGQSISVSIANYAFILGQCIFDPGPHEVLVKAVVNGTDVDQCIASYVVEDADKQCSVKIEPTSGITSATEVKVSGENLTKDGVFTLFFDNKIMSGPSRLSTPSFSEVVVPTSLLTPGSHSIDVRKPYGGALTGNTNDYAPPLCRAFFTVGTPNNPGSLTSAGGSGSTATGPQSISGGQGCEGDKDNPSINTAIGCIHTSPIGFIKDFLKFILGISGGLAFLMMLLGAFQMLTSAGNPDTLKAGQERLTSAVVGLLFVIFSVLLLQIIGFDILGIPGFGK